MFYLNMQNTKSVSTPNFNSSLWRSRLASALRMTLACAIVGFTALYSPIYVRKHLQLPSFSYLTAVLILNTDSTLGESIKGAICALCGSALGILLPLLTLYTTQMKEISIAMIAFEVAISSFVVLIVFDSSELIVKRIALCQIVIVYVSLIKEMGEGKPKLDPLPVAMCTAVGAVASVLALVVPYPRLAYCQVKEKNKVYAELAMERLRLIVNGICADSNSCMASWAIQAKTLTLICTKHIQNIKLIQGSMQLERLLFKFLSPLKREEQWNHIQEIEAHLKGMEMALALSTSTPLKILDQQLKDDLNNYVNQISIKLRQGNSSITQPFHLPIPQNLRHLPLQFFLFCTKLLYNVVQSSPSSNPLQDNKVSPTTEGSANTHKDEEVLSTKKLNFKSTIWPTKISSKRFVVALKISLSLSLAVILGILFSKENGCWSGLAVAIAIAQSGNSTFKSASVRAHGTALGSVYGVIGSFIAQHLMEVRLLILLPWIVFTSFLQCNRMYGETGAFAATISAIVILGRRNYGSPKIFSVERLTETYIGLFCAVIFELMLQPKRASTLARARLSKSLEMLRQCLNSVASPLLLKENEKKLRTEVNELKKFITEAELEPNFWFLPLNVACYNKLHGSLSKMVDLLLFMGRASHANNEAVKVDLEHFRKLVVSSVELFEYVIQMKSLSILVSSSNDIETGNRPRCSGHEDSSVYDEEGSEKILASFLRHAEKMMGKLDESVSEESKSEVILCLVSFGLCIGELMKEVKRLEEGIVELVQWENPYSHIDLHEISCKLKDVSV